MAGVHMPSPDASFIITMALLSTGSLDIALHLASVSNPNGETNMLAPLTNVGNGLKRKAKDTTSQENASSKKPTASDFKQLKSVRRTMSVNQTKAALERCNDNIQTTDKTIKDKKKEIWALKKQLKEAEAALKSAELSKSSLYLGTTSLIADTKTEACGAHLEQCGDLYQREAWARLDG